MQGNDVPYQELVSHFLPTPTSPIPDFATTLPLIQAITSSVSLLTSLHSSLVTAIVSLPWAVADERFVRSYVALTGTLASARPEWVGEIANRAVKGLTWRTLRFGNVINAGAISNQYSLRQQKNECQFILIIHQSPADCFIPVTIASSNIFWSSFRHYRQLFNPFSSSISHGKKNLRSSMLPIFGMSWMWWNIVGMWPGRSGKG